MLPSIDSTRSSYGTRSLMPAPHAWCFLQTPNTRQKSPNTNTACSGLANVPVCRTRLDLCNSITHRCRSLAKTKQTNIYPRHIHTFVFVVWWQVFVVVCQPCGAGIKMNLTTNIDGAVQYVLCLSEFDVVQHHLLHLSNHRSMNLCKRIRLHV